MKPKILKLSTVVLLLFCIGAGCQKDDIFELDIGDKNAVIQKEVNGIEFKFCLLNEQGEPATIFNEGENFFFQFSIKNNTNESLPFYDYGYYDLDDFCAVNSGNKFYGKPFVYKVYSGTFYTADRRLLPPGSENYKFIVPWYDERNDWQLFWGEFESTKQPLLKKGKYYTQFAYSFSFGIPNNEPELETGLIKFKINFEIK